MEPKTNSTDVSSKLAFELLGEIFFHCLPPDTDPISSKNGPLLLVQVCHRWREVAFATPRLWQVIQMRRKWTENPIFILDLFLNKSGNLPVTITLHNAKTAERNEAIINRVLDDFHRVSSLTGHTSRLFPYFVFKRVSAPCAPRRIHAPLLKHLDITGFDMPSELSKEEDRIYVRNCIIASNLQELHLNSSRIMLSMVCFSPDHLRVLTGLYLTDVIPITDMSFLCQTKNLESLDFCVYDNFEDTTLKFPPSVCFPNVKRLHMSFTGDRFTEIIRSLYFPNLESLSLFLRSEISFPHFLEFLTKGQTPPLRSLLLSYSNESDDPASRLSCFHKFREVEELTLYSFSLDEITIQTLMDKEGSEFRLFPQLSSITIRKLIFNSDCKSIIKVLRTRSITWGGTLSYAKFLNCGFALPEDKDALEALQMETDGKLKIDIVTDDTSKWVFPF